MTMRSVVFLILSLFGSFLHSFGQGTIRDTSGSKRNVVSVVPFQFTENGIGFGASYERRFGRHARVAFYLPAMVTFDIANSNRIYNFNTGNYSTGKADAMFYTMPGIKYYLAGSSGKVSYATGASFVLGAGQKSGDLANLNGMNETEQVQAHYITGLMWQNSVNVSISGNLFLGVELGLGGTLMNRVGTKDMANEFLIQGALKIGYMF